MMHSGYSNLKFTKTKEKIIDLIFPKKCFGCGLLGKYLCENCNKKILIKSGFECPICRKSNFGGLVCGNCCGESNLNYLLILSDYGNLVKEIISSIKYDFIVENVQIFDAMIVKYFNNLNYKYDNSLIVPVPLHRRRKLERGFNQADLIADRIVNLIGGVKEDKLLRRIIYSRPQAKLKAQERRINLKDNFVINDEVLSFINRNRNILLVDDVYTTGSTMQECAKVLKSSGFNNIGGFVIARGGG